MFNEKILASLSETLSVTIPSIRRDIETFVSNPNACEALENAYCDIQQIVDVAEMMQLTDLQELLLSVREKIEQIANCEPNKNDIMKVDILQVVDKIQPFFESNYFNNQEAENSLQERIQASVTLANGLILNRDEKDELTHNEAQNKNDFFDKSKKAQRDYSTKKFHENEQSDFDMDLSKELLEGFIIEAEEYLDIIGNHLPNINSKAKENNELLQIRRSVHTLKGSAGIVGLLGISNLSHRMEDMLDRLYDGDMILTSQSRDLLFETFDILEDFIRDKHAVGDISHIINKTLSKYDIILGQNQSNFDCDSIDFSKDIDQLKLETTVVAKINDNIERFELPTLADQESQNLSPNADSLRVPVIKVDELISLVSDLTISQSVYEQNLIRLIRQIDELHLSINRLHQSSLIIETQYEVSTLTQKFSNELHHKNKYMSTSKSEWTGLIEFDELELDRYNKFHIVSRDLAETSADICALGHELKEILSGFDSYLNRQNCTVNEIQHKLMQLRMIPFSTLSSRLNRAVRVTAKQRNKDVILSIVGESVQFDKVMLDELNEVLMHMLRNAVDHGIEDIEVRASRGKPEYGQLHLAASREGTQLIVRLSDDGGGLDAERIRATALRNGLISEAEATNWHEDQLYLLIFSPGFSTAPEVSEVSGRGVGMDIVQSTVGRLKGKLQIESSPGLGTTITIYLPLNLAMAKVLLVESCRQTFAFQLSEVIEILKIESDIIEARGKEKFVQHENQVLPIINLAEVLNLSTNTEQQINRLFLVIIESSKQRIAFIVNNVLGSREVVMKDLGSHLKDVKGLIGSTLLGDGTIVLILKPDDFGSNPTTCSYRVTNSVTNPPSSVKPYKIMIVDDSYSVRRVVANLVKSMNWEPILAKNGFEALDLLQNLSLSPDLILLDVEMPLMNGYELTSTLRSQAAFKDLPIIMLTSRSGEKHRRKAFEMGATEYLIKPYQDRFLTETINSLIVKAKSTPQHKQNRFG